MAKFADPLTQAWLAERGDDWTTLLEQYTDVINAVAAGAPGGMRVGLHLCRGNNRGTWQAQGSYDGISEKLFRKLIIDFFFLEFDTPRAGGFEPLRKLPEHKVVVLGLLSTKLRRAEPTEALVARIREASRFVSLERLAVSPQCGFWGGINLCSKDEMETKLRRVAEVAQTVWK